jgi:hypothetical protein
MEVWSPKIMPEKETRIPIFFCVEKSWGQKDPISTPRKSSLKNQSNTVFDCVNTFFEHVFFSVA